MPEPLPLPEPGAGAKFDLAPAPPERLLADALSFLGHDVREGHTSILALIELARLRNWPSTAAELAPRLEQVARRALAAVDDFLQLVALRERTPVPEPLDWTDFWSEAWADAWPLADRRGLRLVSTPSPQPLPGRADRVLLGVLLRRLIEEAIERSAAGSDLTGGLRRTPAGLTIELELVAAGATAMSAHDRAARRSALGWRIVLQAAERLRATVEVDESSRVGMERLSVSAPLS